MHVCMQDFLLGMGSLDTPGASQVEEGEQGRSNYYVRAFAFFSAAAAAAVGFVCLV